MRHSAKWQGLMGRALPQRDRHDLHDQYYSAEYDTCRGERLRPCGNRSIEDLPYLNVGPSSASGRNLSGIELTGNRIAACVPFPPASGTPTRHDVRAAQ